MTNSPHQSGNKTHQFHLFNHLLASLDKYLWSVCCRPGVGLPGWETRAHRGFEASPQLQADRGQILAKAGWIGPACCSDFSGVLVPATQPTLRGGFLICKRKTKSLARIVKTSWVLDPLGLWESVYVNGFWSLAGKIDISKYKSNLWLETDP